MITSCKRADGLRTPPQYTTNTQIFSNQSLIRAQLLNSYWSVRLDSFAYYWRLSDSVSIKEISTGTLDITRTTIIDPSLTMVPPTIGYTPINIQPTNLLCEKSTRDHLSNCSKCILSVSVSQYELMDMDFNSTKFQSSIKYEICKLQVNIKQFAC